MKTSESVKEFMTAFVKAQQEITFAKKDAMNPHLKSKYADLPEVIDAIKVCLNSNGIAYIQTPEESETAGVLRMTTRLMHVSGEWIESVMSMPISKTDAQGYGSGLTYARRYSLAAITGLYQDDDDGYAASRHAQANKPKEKLSDDRFNKAIEAIKAGKYNIAKMAEFDLTDKQQSTLADIEASLGEAK